MTLLCVSILVSFFVCVMHPQCETLHWQGTQGTLISGLEITAAAVSYWSSFILTLLQAVLC